MKNHLLLIFSSVALLVAASASGLRAQDSSQVAYSSDATSAKATKAAAAKPHKVWTEDDLGTVRTVADKYKDQKAADAQGETGAANQPKANKPAPPPAVGGRSLLSNPKSPEDADRMIAWEDRDLEAQLEFADRLRAQLHDAAPQDRDHLKEQLAERMKIIEEIKQEKASLVQQKNALAKKPAPSSDSAEQDAPAQQ
jgi:hypothetical protein